MPRLLSLITARVYRAMELLGIGGAQSQSLYRANASPPSLGTTVMT
jgi:hypothetical protein